jgi:hypothetical protein
MLSCPTNERYGHADVYRTYASLPVGACVNGRLQHGWSAEQAGITAGDKLHKLGCNFFVWSEEKSQYGRDHEDNLHELPKEKTYVVGAPLLYMPIDHYDRLGDTLAISKHSLRKNVVSKESWTKYLEFVRSYDKSAYVLIHQRDVDLGYGKLIRDFGLMPITAGEPYSLDFIYNLVKIIGSFDHVIATNVQTACFYALYMCKFVKICGPKITSDIPAFCDRFVTDDEWTRKNYPQLLTGTFDFELGAKELGAKSKKSPSGLRRLMFNA